MARGYCRQIFSARAESTTMLYYLALVLTVLVAAGTELVRVTPTAKQVCCAKVSACWRSLPVHEDWMHWVVEETKAGLLQRHLLSLLAHPPRLALVRQVSPHAEGYFSKKITRN